VHTEEQQVEVHLTQGRHRHRTHESVRWRADAAGQDDRAPGRHPALQGLRDLHAVGDHREVGYLRQALGKCPGGGAGGQPDRHARLDQRSCGSRDRVLLRLLAHPLGLEARFLGAQGCVGRGAAVDLVDEPLAGQDVQVTADGHVRDPEEVGQQGHAHRSATTDLVRDAGLSFGGKHGVPSGVSRPVCHRPTETPAS